MNQRCTRFHPLIQRALSEIGRVWIASSTNHVWRVLLLVVMLLSALIRTATPAAAQPKGCAYGNLGGIILDRWRELGGSNSWLGCPLTADEEVGPNDGRARLRRFEHGQGVWSPWTGGLSVLFAWREGDGIRLQWKTTEPYNYDKWLVGWDIDGQYNDNNQAELRDQPRSEGTFYLPNPSWYHDYAFRVEGCDDPGFLGHSSCKQGWMHPVTIARRIPGLRVDLVVNNATTNLYDNDTILRDVLDASWGAIRVPAKTKLVQYLEQRPEIHDETSDLAEIGEAHSWMENGDIKLEYIVPGRVDAHLNWPSARTCGSYLPACPNVNHGSRIFQHHVRVRRQLVALYGSQVT